MSVDENFGSFFRAEVKSSGRKLVDEKKVTITAESDTSVQAFFKTSPPVKVNFRARDIGAPSFAVECTCPAARKSRYCKHIWAAILCLDEARSDFLSEKRSIDEIKVTEKPVDLKKQKAAEYRKAQYQRQKSRLKAEKRGREFAYPKVVEAAMKYFEENGFPMPDGPSREILSEAKRKLARVFHPDKGGTHEELVELNLQYEILNGYLSR